jgi:hypothetical protein
MADIRIKDLATTAASTASDDFVAVDGSANGTRKLNAYSPTFGGNLTVSGTGNSSIAGNLGIGETSPVVPLHVKTTGTGTGDFDNAIATFRSTAAGRTITLQFSDTTNQAYISSKSGALNFGVGGATLGMSLSSAGNLTVSGRDLTLGSSESVIYFGTPSANYLYYNGSSLFLRVGSVDRITIPGGTGNVLIGTTTDGGQKLQVNGSVNVFGGGTLTVTNAANTANIIRSSDSSGNAVDTVFKATGTTYAVRTTDTSGNLQTALTLDSSQNATFAGSVKAASQVYAEKSGAGIAGQSVGLVTQFTTVNSTTYSVTTAAAKVFVVQLGSGDAALCYTSYKSSTITILGSDGTIVNSNSPSSTQLGIWKGANDHVIYFVTGSNALAGSYGSWGFCFLGNPVISIA